MTRAVGSWAAVMPWRWLLALVMLVGCGPNLEANRTSSSPPLIAAAAEASEPVEREDEASEGATADGEESRPQVRKPNVTTSDEQHPAAESADNLANNDPPPAATQSDKPTPPAEPPATEKQRAVAIALRIQKILNEIAAGEPTAAEKELLDQIQAKQELNQLLAADIADEQANPQRPGLLMPWEYRNRDFMAAVPGANMFKSPRPNYSLALSAAFGNEQLASVERERRRSSYALANLRAQRAWSKLSTAEQSECRRLQPEFAAEASGENAKRLEELTAQITSSPDDPKVHGERAQLHWQRGDLASATADYRRAIQLSGENVHALRLQFAQLCEESGDNWNAKTEYQQVAHSEAAVEPALRLDAYIRWGYVLLRERRTEAAMQAVNQAVTIDDNNAGVHLLAAEVYKQIGATPMLIGALESAVEAEPENAGMHYRLANALAQLGRQDPALASYSKAIELEPTWWRPRAGKASLLYRQGDKEGALVELNEALKWEPGEASLVESRSVVLQDLGRTAEENQHP